MDIKISKGLSIVLYILMFTSILIGLQLSYLFIKTINPQNGFSLTFLDLSIGNLNIIFTNIERIVMGLWFLINAPKLKQDNHTWMAIGLIYGKYSIVLFVLLLLLQNIYSKTDLIKSISPLLILLIISFFLRLSIKHILTPYMTFNYDAFNYGFITEYTIYISFFIYALIIFTNVIFAIRLAELVRKMNIQKKSIWIIATIFFGVFTVILLNILSRVNNNNAT